jgi:hypothetical protein
MGALLGRQNKARFGMELRSAEILFKRRLAGIFWSRQQAVARVSPTNKIGLEQTLPAACPLPAANMNGSGG